MSSNGLLAANRVADRRIVATLSSRRRVLWTTMASAAALWSGAAARPARPIGVPPLPGPVGAAPLRFAYMTDPHVYPNARVERGMPIMLDRLAALDPAPSFLVTGGDHINDAFVSSRSDAHQQWELYLHLMHRGCELPKFGVIGNHDIAGWGNPNASPAERDYGKAMALDQLGLDRSYYSFTAGGWAFIILDNITRRDHGYQADIDSQQLEWLKHELTKIDPTTPICLFTHIPLLSICALFDTGVAQRDSYRISDSSMQPRVGDLLDVFSPLGRPAHNLRLCLSGHLHMVDRIDYRGIAFHCGGAVCGNWWQGPYQGHAPGFSVLDLWPDGASAHQYITY